MEQNNKTKNGVQSVKETKKKIKTLKNNKKKHSKTFKTL